jgi:NAD(P)-dependent dehydrogenase (short-subunit alcohol dehydrogenase family)
VPADVTDGAAVERAVATVERDLGPVDLLVNNAGVMSPIGAFWELDVDDGGEASRSICAERPCAPGRSCRLSTKLLAAGSAPQRAVRI